MFKNIEFNKSVFDSKLLPTNKLPEVVLCGRSNVGKSSFINSLMNVNKIAKVSSTPGKTKSINYYLIDNKFYLVDLPGFGFASVSQAEKEKWKALISSFFGIESDLRIVVHLVDIRHPETKADEEFSRFILAKEILPIVLLTKHDKAKQSEVSFAKKSVASLYKSKVKIITYSSMTGFGKKEVLNALKEALR